MALEGGDVKRFGMIDVFVFSALFYSSAAGTEMCFIKRESRCLSAEFLCDVRVWVLLLKCSLLHGTSDVVGCSAVGNVEQRFEQM